jgi:nicotinamide-nucleotide amidase
VCGAVAVAMARGALAHSPADIAISITGVAGPEPDEDGNPVGRVCIGLARDGAAQECEFHYGNLGRDDIQARAMTDALKLVIAAMEAA